jgi:hypothetical protein
MALSGLLDGRSPQHFLAEEMIIIVTHFSAEVVTFIFRGRNSGQLQAMPIRNGCIAKVFAHLGELTRPSLRWNAETSSISESFSARGSDPQRPQECSFDRRIGFGLRRTR